MFAVRKMVTENLIFEGKNTRSYNGKEENEKGKEHKWAMYIRELQRLKCIANQKLWLFQSDICMKQTHEKSAQTF